MQKAFVQGFGCSFNLNETEKIKGFLKENSFFLVESPEKANVIIMHTCAVKKPTESKMLNNLKKLLSINSKAKIIVSGCLPEINRKALENIKGIEIAGSTLKSIARKLSLPEKDFSPLIAEEKFNELVSIIAIEKGCLSNCGFCAVPFARGKLKSFKLNELKKSFQNNLIKSKEFWITGQDIACYGFDINLRLPDLLKEFLKEKQNFRLRLGMMNPKFFSLIKKDLINLMKKDERIYKFLHLPVQSGSNEILKLMRRPYTVEEFIELIEFARKKIKGITIATDIIVGYPQESEADFKETINLIKELKFDVVNISRFGERPNIFANTLKGKIPGSIKKQRSKVLSELCKKISFEKNKALEGSEQLILVTEKGKNNSFVGRTNYYKPVVIKENFLGHFIKVKIIKAFPTFLEAKPLND